MNESSQLRVLMICCGMAARTAVAKDLEECGATIFQVDTWERAVADAATLRPPAVVLLNGEADGLDARTLANLRGALGERFPVVLIADKVLREWRAWLADGLIDDMLPCRVAEGHWRLRCEIVWQAFARTMELRSMRRAAAQKLDASPGNCIHSRAGLLSVLFRETDRVQRMGTSLAVMAFDAEAGGGIWREGSVTSGGQIVGRLQRLLRSYDVLGEVRRGLLLAGLPGCSARNAVRLAERARDEISATAWGGPAGCLLPCFGIAESHGRSPLIVLREAEQALAAAHEAGPGSICTFGHGRQSLRGQEIALFTKT